MLLWYLFFCLLFCFSFIFFFFFNDTATTEIYTLSLHDALPLWEPRRPPSRAASCALRAPWARIVGRPGGPPRLVTIIEPGRVATWVWPAARTVMSLPNTKTESVW